MWPFIGSKIWTLLNRSMILVLQTATHLNLILIRLFSLIFNNAKPGMFHFYAFLSSFRWFGLMPAYSKTDDTLATKLVSVYPNNHDKGLPSHLAHVLLYEAETGVLKAVRANINISNHVESTIRTV